MSAKFVRMALFAGLSAMIAGCNTSNVLDGGASAQQKNRESEVDSVTGQKVVQGTCPPILLREGTAYYRQYARGGQDDPDKVVYKFFNFRIDIEIFGVFQQVAKSGKPGIGRDRVGLILF